MCNDPETAEDLVQETFAAATSAIKRFEGRSSQYTWLYGIFLNKFRSWLRKKKKKKDTSLEKHAEQMEMGNIGELVESDAPDIPEILQKNERAEAVRAAINELPSHHKDVLTLRYLEGMSYEKISGVMDCSVGTVKSRLHYALKKVGERLRSDPKV